MTIKEKKLQEMRRLLAEKEAKFQATGKGKATIDRYTRVIAKLEAVSDKYFEAVSDMSAEAIIYVNSNDEI